MWNLAAIVFGVLLYSISGPLGKIPLGDLILLIYLLILFVYFVYLAYWPEQEDKGKEGEKCGGEK